jgi:hypothetical protein
MGARIVVQKQLVTWNGMPKCRRQERGSCSGDGSRSLRSGHLHFTTFCSYEISGRRLVESVIFCVFPGTNVQVVRVLLEHGADVTVRGCQWDGRVGHPYTWRREWDIWELRTCFLNTPRTPDTTAETEDGRTPLYTVWRRWNDVWNAVQNCTISSRVRCRCDNGPGQGRTNSVGLGDGKGTCS